MNFKEIDLDKKYTPILLRTCFDIYPDDMRASMETDFRKCKVTYVSNIYDTKSFEDYLRYKYNVSLTARTEYETFNELGAGTKNCSLWAFTSSSGLVERQDYLVVTPNMAILMAEFSYINSFTKRKEIQVVYLIKPRNSLHKTFFTISNYLEQFEEFMARNEFIRVDLITRVKENAKYDYETSLYAPTYSLYLSTGEIMSIDKLTYLDIITYLTTEGCK